MEKDKAIKKAKNSERKILYTKHRLTDEGRGKHCGEIKNFFIL
jgi:hypothetical protein